MLQGKNIILWLLIAAACMPAGCRSLPRAEEKIELAFGELNPLIISSVGTLSRRQSSEVLEQPRQAGSSTEILQRNIAAIESITQSLLVKGNKATPLIDGKTTYPAMFSAMRDARDHINVETYRIADDEIGQQFAELALQKQAEGVQVNIIYDSVGSLRTDPAFFKRLSDAGIRVCEFNRLNPFKSARGSWGLLNRDHRKLFIADGKTVIIGGSNIGQVYSSRFSGKVDPSVKVLPWRDTDVLIEGPVAAEFQKMFLDTWHSQSGNILTDRSYFPPLQEKGDILVRAIGSSSGDDNRFPFLAYVSAILFAKHSIYLTHAYFLPDDQILEALYDAARRGVDVKIILPSASDSKYVLHAQRHAYTPLLESGVRIYECRDVLLHAKTAVIDSVWSTIGSTNLDYWSLLHHSEVNAIILNREFAAEMEKIFAQDLARSDEIELEKWKKRPLLQKVRENFMQLFISWM